MAVAGALGDHVAERGDGFADGGDVSRIEANRDDAIEDIAFSARQISVEAEEISETAKMLTEMARADEDLILPLIID